MQLTLSRRELLKQIALGSALVSIPAATTSVAPKKVSQIWSMGWVHGAKREEIRTTKLKLEVKLQDRSLNDVRVAVAYEESDAFYKYVYPLDAATENTLFGLAERNKWEMAENQRTALRRFAVQISNWHEARTQFSLPVTDMVWRSLVEYAQEQVTVATPEDYAHPKPRLSICWRDRDDGEFARNRYPNAKQLLHLNFDEVYTECFKRVGTGNQIYDPTRLEDGRKLLDAPTQFRFTEEEMAFFDFKVTDAIRETPAWHPLRRSMQFLAAMDRNNERHLDGESQYQEFPDGRRLIISSIDAAGWTTDELLADYGNELWRCSLDVSNG